mgnify:CR=1 FL=1
MIMKKSTKKSILSYVIVGALSLSMFSGTSAFAAENANTKPVKPVPVRVVVPESNILISPTSNVVQPSIDSNVEVAHASVPTYISKKALKWAIDNTTTITNYVGRVLGDKAAAKVGNAMHNYVKPALRKLEALDKVTYGKLEDTIYDALKKPVGSGTARVAARVIVEAIKFFAPIWLQAGG